MSRTETTINGNQISITTTRLLDGVVLQKYTVPRTVIIQGVEFTFSKFGSYNAVYHGTTTNALTIKNVTYPANTNLMFKKPFCFDEPEDQPSRFARLWNQAYPEFPVVVTDGGSLGFYFETNITPSVDNIFDEACRLFECMRGRWIEDGFLPHNWIVIQTPTGPRTFCLDFGASLVIKPKVTTRHRRTASDVSDTFWLHMKPTYDKFFNEHSKSPIFIRNINLIKTLRYLSMYYPEIENVSALKKNQWLLSVFVRLHDFYTELPPDDSTFDIVANYFGPAYVDTHNLREKMTILGLSEILTYKLHREREDALDFMLTFPEGKARQFFVTALTTVESVVDFYNYIKSFTLPRAIILATYNVTLDKFSFVEHLDFLAWEMNNANIEIATRILDFSKQQLNVLYELAHQTTSPTLQELSLILTLVEHFPWGKQDVNAPQFLTESANKSTDSAVLKYIREHPACPDKVRNQLSGATVSAAAITSQGVFSASTSQQSSQSFQNSACLPEAR